MEENQISFLHLIPVIALFCFTSYLFLKRVFCMDGCEHKQEERKPMIEDFEIPEVVKLKIKEEVKKQIDDLFENKLNEIIEKAFSEAFSEEKEPEKENHRLFGEIAVEEGYITPIQLDEALKLQKEGCSVKPIGYHLKLQNSIIALLLSKQFEIPYITLDYLDIDRQIICQLDGSIATLYRVIPIKSTSTEMHIATADPTNIGTIDNLERLLEKNIRVYVTTSSQITNALKKYYPTQPETVPS